MRISLAMTKPRKRILALAIIFVVETVLVRIRPKNADSNNRVDRCKVIQQGNSAGTECLASCWHSAQSSRAADFLEQGPRV